MNINELHIKSKELRLKLSDINERLFSLGELKDALFTLEDYSENLKKFAYPDFQEKASSILSMIRDEIEATRDLSSIVLNELTDVNRKIKMKELRPVFWEDSKDLSDEHSFVVTSIRGNSVFVEDVNTCSKYVFDRQTGTCLNNPLVGYKIDINKTFSNGEF